MKYLKDLSKLVFAKVSPVFICWQFVGSESTESTEPGLSYGSVVLVIQFLQGLIYENLSFTECCWNDNKHAAKP